MCLPGDNASRQPATILRDTAASLSILLKGMLSVTKETESSNSALVRGVEMNWFWEPLFNVVLESDLVTGPVEGISFLLGHGSDCHGCAQN